MRIFDAFFDDIVRMWRGMFHFLAVVMVILLLFVTFPVWCLPYVLIKRIKRKEAK